MTIGELMREKRQELGMSLEDVGKIVGVNRTTIQRWETGAMNIDRKHIQAISNTLHLDPMIFCHPNEVIFSDERILIEAWRAADELSKEMVRRTLGISEKNDTSESEKLHTS